MKLFTILTELLAVMMKLLNFSDIIDHIYDIIENGNGIVDWTNSNVIRLCAIIDHAGYIIYPFENFSPKFLISILTVVHMEVGNYHHGSCVIFHICHARSPSGYFIRTPGASAARIRLVFRRLGVF